jgi:hypothetical protein
MQPLKPKLTMRVEAEPLELRIRHQARPKLVDYTAVKSDLQMSTLSGTTAQTVKKPPPVMMSERAELYL